jgi:transposase-like protein
LFVRSQRPDGKTWGGRRPGTRVRLTEEKEAAIRQLHGEGKAVASIARTVGLDRKTVYRALARAGAGPGASERAK